MEPVYTNMDDPFADPIGPCDSLEFPPALTQPGRPKKKPASFLGTPSTPSAKRQKQERQLYSEL